MNDKIARNAPCPCGSGEKYKRCHGAPGAEPLKEGEGLVARERRGISRGMLNALAAGVVLVAVILGVTDHTDLAAATLGFGVMGLLGLFVFGNLPPPRGDAGDPGAINFGG